MATIANQIARIQNATKQLRDKGIDLELNVSGEVALNSDHKLDDVAKAFDNITYKNGVEIPVELKVVTDGTTTIGNSFNLDPGFYRGCVIKPYFTQSSVTDMVLNIQTWNNTITSKEGTLVPITGDNTNYNYFDKVVYKVQSGAIKTTPQSYSNTYVKALVSTAGWLDKDATQDIVVPTATITSQVGSNSATMLSNANTTTKVFTVKPNATQDTVLTIAAGIYASARTIKVTSLASQMSSATAQAGDILQDKIAYGNNGTIITGSMTNRGGTSSSLTSTTSSAVDASTGQIIVTPQSGYYNTHSRITTGLTVGSATYEQNIDDLKETDHKFEVKPADDGDGTQTTYLTQVTIDNSYIYGLLAAI